MILGKGHTPLRVYGKGRDQIHMWISWPSSQLPKNMMSTLSQQYGNLALGYLARADMGESTSRWLTCNLALPSNVFIKVLYIMKPSKKRLQSWVSCVSLYSWSPKYNQIGRNVLGGQPRSWPNFACSSFWEVKRRWLASLLGFCWRPWSICYGKTQHLCWHCGSFNLPPWFLYVILRYVL